MTERPDGRPERGDDPSGDRSAGWSSRWAERIRRAHDQAMAAGRPDYRDPATGYVVMTEATLAARGACCGSGCRHCPYPPDEQRRAGRPGT